MDIHEGFGGRKGLGRHEGLAGLTSRRGLGGHEGLDGCTNRRCEMDEVLMGWEWGAGRGGNILVPSARVLRDRPRASSHLFKGRTLNYNQR